jgi:hypothetical protein
VAKSWAIADRGDGASIGAPLVSACATASAKTDSKKKREKLAILNTVAFIIFAPCSAEPNARIAKLLGTRAMLRHTPGQTADVYLRTTGPDERRSHLREMRRRIAANTTEAARSVAKR